MLHKIQLTDPFSANKKTIAVVLSLLTAILGYLSLNSSVKLINTPTDLTKWLENQLNPSIPLLNNIIPGLVLFGAGALLTALLIKTGSWPSSLENTQTQLKQHSTRWRELLKFSAVTLTAIAITTYRLDSIPNSIIPDEGYFFAHAKQIAQGENPFPFFGFGTYTFPAASNYYQAFFMKIFKPSIWSWRLSSVVAGVLTIPALYLLTRQLFSKQLALLAVIMTISLPYFLSLSRLGYNNIHALPIVTWGVFLIVLGIKKNSYLISLLAGLVAGLSFFTYTASLLVLAMAVLIYLTAVLHSETKLKTIILVLLFTLGLVFSSLPRLQYNYKTDPQSARNKLAESFITNEFYVKTVYPQIDTSSLRQIKIDQHTLILSPGLFIRLAARNLIRTITILTNNSLLRQSYPYAFLASSLTYPFALFFAIGFFISILRWKEPKHALFLAWLLTALLFLSVLNTFGDRHWHLVPVIPALSFFSAIGFTTLEHFLTRQTTSRHWQLFIHSVLTAILIFLLTKGLCNYFQKVPLFFPANAENLLSFKADELRHQPANLIYVSSSASLLNSQWVPWYLSNLPNTHHFKILSPQELGRLAKATLPRLDTWIFFDASEATVALPQLASNYAGVLQETSNHQGETVSYTYFIKKTP